MCARLDRFAHGCACGRALSLPPCTRLQFRGAAHASRLRTQTLVPALQGSDFANVWCLFAFGDLHEPPIAVCVKAPSFSLDEWKAGPVGPREPAHSSSLKQLFITYKVFCTRKIRSYLLYKNDHSFIFYDTTGPVVHDRGERHTKKWLETRAGPHD